MATMDMDQTGRRRASEFSGCWGWCVCRTYGESFFSLVLADKGVKAMLVNIFAGINRCSWITEGVVHAVKNIDMKVPLVVRLSGHGEEGQRIIAESSLPDHYGGNIGRSGRKLVQARNAVIAKEREGK